MIQINCLLVKVSVLVLTSWGWSLTFLKRKPKSLLLTFSESKMLKGSERGSTVFRWRPRTMPALCCRCTSLGSVCDGCRLQTKCRSRMWRAFHSRKHGGHPKFRCSGCGRTQTLAPSVSPMSLMQWDLPDAELTLLVLATLLWAQGCPI